MRMYLSGFGASRRPVNPCCASPRPVAWAKEVRHAIPLNPTEDAYIPICRSPPETTAGFTLVELLVVVSIIALLLGILLPATQSAREAARKTRCANNLRQTGQAVAAHHAQRGHFPPGSNTPDRGIGLSWTVHVLPYLELTAIYDDIEPTAGPSGKSWRFAKQPIELFRCPSSRSERRNICDYAGVMGAGQSQFVVEDQATFGSVYNDGVFFPDSQTTTAHIKDGLSNTIAIGERNYIPRQNNSWMNGSLWSGSPTTMIGVMSAKNVVWPINSYGRQSGYFVGDPAAEPSQRKILMNDLMFGSGHPGGAQFLHADGGVRFLTDNMSFALLQQLASIDGGEIAAAD